MYPNLRAEMARNKIRLTDIAKVIHKTSRCVQDKMNGVGDFSLIEARAIQTTFFPDLSLDYLFVMEGKEKPA